MKNKRREIMNLVFSAFLVIGFVVCSYFFSSLSTGLAVTQPVISTVIAILIPLLFGLILFYATRVGEGKPVKRFSLVVLLMIDLPALLILLLTFVPISFIADFQSKLQAQPIVYMLAAIALGYGLPYTFFSGFELAKEDEDDDEDDKDDDDEEYEEEENKDEEEDEEEPVKPVKGGILEELQAADEDEKEDEDADKASDDE